MNIPEIIEELQKIQKVHGDLPIKFGNTHIEFVRANTTNGRYAELLRARPVVFISKKPLARI